MPAFEVRDSYYEYYPTPRSLFTLQALTLSALRGRRGGYSYKTGLVYQAKGTHDTRRTRLTLTHAHFCVAAGAGSSRSHSGGLRSLRTALRHLKKVVIVVITEHHAKECARITWEDTLCCARILYYNASPGCTSFVTPSQSSDTAAKKLEHLKGRRR